MKACAIELLKEWRALQSIVDAFRLVINQPTNILWDKKLPELYQLC